MILFPAIDIIKGRAVRLLYGQKKQVTDYGTPLEYALKWQACGAQYLHIVDLDGAFGECQNLEVVGEIIKNINIPIQLGGGIRSMESIEKRLKLGVARVILGTAACNDKQMLKQAVQEFGNRIVCGIDSRNNKVAIRGWTESTDTTPYQLAVEMFELGIKTVVFTDISKDGALNGVNATACEQMSKSGLNIIASGGVTSLEDIEILKKKNIYGAIIGKALYEGKLSLVDALKGASNEL